MLWMLKTISHRQHHHHRSVHLLKVSPVVPFFYSKITNIKIFCCSRSRFTQFHFILSRNCCGQKNVVEEEKMRLKIWIMIAEVYEENFTTVWTTFLILLTRWSPLKIYSVPNPSSKEWKNKKKLKILIFHPRPTLILSATFIHFKMR